MSGSSGPLTGPEPLPAPDAGAPEPRDRWRFVRPLAHRDFRVLFGAVVLSIFGAGMWAVVMVYSVIDAGGGPVDFWSARSPAASRPTGSPGGCCCASSSC